MLNEEQNVNFTKPMLKDVCLLREWMPFSGEETSIFQHYFI